MFIVALFNYWGTPLNASRANFLFLINERWDLKWSEKYEVAGGCRMHDSTSTQRMIATGYSKIMILTNFVSQVSRRRSASFYKLNMNFFTELIK